MRSHLWQLKTTLIHHIVQNDEKINEFYIEFLKYVKK